MTGAMELVLGAEADAVPRARQFAATALSTAAGPAVDDVELVVTELVTNALLHGSAPVTLRLHRTADSVRVEVEDMGRGMPVLVRESNDALTGRGLRLVAALSCSWGVETGTNGGKVVWADLPDAGTDVADAPEPDLDVDAFLASWEEPEETLYSIRLGAVPTELLLDAKAQIDNLVREYRLSSSGGGMSPEAAQLAKTIIESLAWARTEIKRQALEAAARGDAETELVLELPASAADAGERYLEALDLADSYARVGQLLTLETPRLHRVFRRWYVGALVDQLRAQSAGRPAPATQTFQQRLVDEVTALAELEEAGEQLRLLQSITAELTGAATVTDIADIVTLNATRALGARSARIYLLDGDGMLRSVATQGGDSPLADRFDQFHIDDDLPGGVALRTNTTIHLRSRAEISRHFPSLADAYEEERTLHVAPLVVGEHQLGVLSLTFLGRSLVDTRTQATFLSALAAACAQALERAAATARAEVATEALAFLADASVALSGRLDYEQTLVAVADLVVPRLADWCVIQVLDRGVLRNAVVKHFDESKVAWALSMEGRYPTDMAAETGAASVIRTGVSELYPVLPPELLEEVAVDAEHLEIIRQLGMSSALVVPLIGRTGTFGAISMIQAESGRRYDEADVAFAEDLARRAALAVETAHAFLEQSGRLAEVSRIAEAAQHAILAPPPKKIGPVALSARYMSATAEALIGGDLYEVVTRPGVVRLLIGDVRGKGLAAVRTATIVLGEFRAAAADVADLVDVAVQIDRRLRPYLGDEDFVTALLAEIADDGSYAIASCGHPPALVATDGSIRTVDTEATMPLGLGANPVLATGRLASGDRLLLYTDGIIEARDPSREFVDLASLVKALGTGALETVLDDILTTLRLRVGSDLDDDMALLVAEYQGS